MQNPKTRVYMDVSRLCLTKFTTGIQRVAKEIVLRFLEDPALEVTLLSDSGTHDAWRVIPREGFLAKYRDGAADLFGDSAPYLLTPFEIPTDAVFFDIDSAWNMPMNRGALLPQLKARGVTVVSQLYDLIPVTEPQFFHAQTMQQFLLWVHAVLRSADRLICNAEATRTALHTLCKQLGVPSPACSVVPLGADFAKGTKSAEEPDRELLAKLTEQRYVLMVGTIEPRKNHALLLQAAEQLAKLDVSVVFAGRIGWNMDEFAKKMAAHPLNGTHFFFAESPNDATVAALYEHALCVAFPTKNEGFGLPIVEAFLHGTPVLASDLPVLREVGGAYADYFDNTSADSLVSAVKALLDDPAGYAEKRAKLHAYQPRTWDETAAEMSRVLQTCSRRTGAVPAETRIRQMAVLTARNDDLLRTLPFLDACMPFIEELLVCCPQKNVQELETAWQGRLRLRFCTDEELLGGQPLPTDHTERNFLLRCLMMEWAPLDDVFIMTDDDYRPLGPVTQEFFLTDCRYQAYCCYDLRAWQGTQGNYTSYDRSMFRTRDFLQAHDLPALQYSSHQPQVIDRKLYLELLSAFPEIRTQGMDEWSVYFNYCVAYHADSFAVRPYRAACWPGAVSDWKLWCQPDSPAFENFYGVLYEPGQIFEGLPKTYDAARFYEISAEKQKRWNAALRKQYAAEQKLRLSAQLYLNRCHLLPQIALSAVDDKPVFTVPLLLELPRGTVLRLRMYAEDAVRAMPAKLTYAVRCGGGEAVPAQTLDLSTLAAGTDPELVLSMPPMPMHGLLTLEFGGARAEVPVVSV